MDNGSDIAEGLRQANELLRGQVREQAENLDQARQDIEFANKAKSQFLSSMSHELRTPLNAIIGFTQLLESDPDHPLSDNQRENLQHIKAAGTHLLSLINEVLELAKLEAGRMDFNISSTALVDVLYDTVPMIQPLAEERGLTFVAPALERRIPNVMVDATRLRQILLNLLSNAVKYNTENGEIVLDCAVKGDSLRISVSDTGIGISQDLQDQLFQPFSRLGREDTGIEGTGIGLTLTKELVEHMNGEVGVNSAQGKGSTFWVEIPLDPDLA